MPERNEVISLEDLNRLEHIKDTYSSKNSSLVVYSEARDFLGQFESENKLLTENIPDFKLAV